MNAFRSRFQTFQSVVSSVGGGAQKGTFMRVKLTSALLALWLAMTGELQGQSLDQEMAGLADRVSKALVAKGFKNVANLDFTDIQGQPTELGRFLSDQLAVEIVSTGGVSMVDRANLKSILAEHKLTEEGLVNPANAKKLGEFAGVDAIMSGNVTAFDDGVVLMVKAISTESASIVAAGRIKFAKTSDIQQLLNRGVGANTPIGAAPPSGAIGGNGPNYQEATAIATRDIGPLRIVLKSVMPMKIPNVFGRSRLGVRCSFEIISRETQRTVSIAANAGAGTGTFEMSQVLRSTINDDRGAIYKLAASSVKGIGVVGVGYRNWSGPSYNPTEIPALLTKQDETRSDRGADDRFPFIYGSPTQLLPGSITRVTMEFLQGDLEAAAGPPPTFFQVDSELVIGISGTEGGKKTYSLHNLTLDRVAWPVAGGK